ncbi:isatin hydrolase-like [Physella acuta]|uniref:isatin hydrolase-like n=1 Tax=Physella acuta TaxID=109671 RepID=UPI0027DD5282|nr:isatin hydrolase-like [Physella acuta]
MATQNMRVLLSFLLLPGLGARLIDLSHDHGPDTIMAPGQPRYNWTVVFLGDILPTVYAETGAYFTGEHGGTHIDAPAHFTKGGMRLEKVPIELTIADGCMIDVSTEAGQTPGYQVPLQKILDWEQAHGEIPQKSAVIFNFGWSKYYTNRTQYLGTETEDVTKFVFPSVSREAGLFLHTQRNIQIIGVDSLNPDAFSVNGQLADGMPIHQNFLPNNKLIVENLKGTEQLPARGFRFHATPVKYVGGTGAQVRAFAMTYDRSDNSCDSVPALWANVLLILTTVLIASILW